MFVFAVFVCDVFKHVWFVCDLLCVGVWSVVCVGLCVRVGFMCLCDYWLKLCWRVLFVVFVCACFMCLRVLCAMYCVMLYGLCVACFVCVNALFIYLCAVFMTSGVLLSGCVVLLCFCDCG